MNYLFQLTRPLRGATKYNLPSVQEFMISTHTPLAGRDMRTVMQIASPSNFNSHAPCGARHIPNAGMGIVILFQLTRPLRGATEAARRRRSGAKISTHTPLAGRDRLAANRSICQFISTHTPLAGRDITVDKCKLRVLVISTHTPLAGRDSKMLYTLPSHRLNQGVDKNFCYSVSFDFA